MSLIQRCVCGHAKSQLFRKYHIPLESCLSCNIIRQRLEMSASAYQDFYKQDYHSAHQQELGREAYKDRYEHDCKVAVTRLDKYSSFIPAKGKFLDIGSGNGALVDTARKAGYDAYGVDFVNHAHTYPGPVEDVGFPTEHFDIITMHDVLEHLVDPVKTLKEVRRILKPGGRLIVDFPNYFVEAGKHHWRPIQHLWYFTEAQLVDVLEKAGFPVTEIDYPIPSKFVAYTFNSKSVASEKKILVLPGMGDIYWTMTKLEGFLKTNGIVLPQVYIWDFDKRPRSKDFTRKFPFVKVAGYWGGAIDSQLLKDTYLTDKKWLVENYKGFDYYVSVNGILASGKDLDGIKEYPTNWYVPMFESLTERTFGKETKSAIGSYVVVFLSDHGMFSEWVKHIDAAEAYTLLKEIAIETGHKIVLTGCNWDVEFNQKLKELDKEGRFLDLVNKTSTDEFFGLVKESSGVIGWCGGNTIMSTVFKKPTIVFWSQEHFKQADFFKNCCPPDSLEKWYFPRVVEKYSASDTVRLAKEAFK